MDFVTMEAYVKICTLESFTKAAEEMFISQSSLSKRISMLEKEVGAVLLDRDRHSIKPTEVGRIYLKKCQEILALHEQTQKEVRAARDGIKYALHIAYPHNIAFRLLLPYVTLMSEQRPDVELNFTALSGNDNIAQKILRKEYDWVLCARGEMEHSPEIVQRFVARPQLSCLVGRNHPLYNREKVSLEDMLEYPFVQYTLPEVGIYHAFVKYYESYGYDRRQIKFVHDRDSVFYYVATGKYVGIGTYGMGGKEEEMVEFVKPILLDDFEINIRNIMCAYRYENRVAEQFADIVVNGKY